MMQFSLFDQVFPSKKEKMLMHFSTMTYLILIIKYELDQIEKN